jgi:hypothetical protein
VGVRGLLRVWLFREAFGLKASPKERSKLSKLKPSTRDLPSPFVGKFID